ncbi:MAG: phosphoribosylaminoimidazolesuccinocarboxamide synthase [Chlorobium sp.]
MNKKDKINLEGIAPVYIGSVQELYSVIEDDEVLISKTTEGGSVFDVGTIFSIKGSGESRALFRNKIFQSLNAKESWLELKKWLENNGSYYDQTQNEIIRDTLNNFIENGANTHHFGLIDALTGDVYEKGMPPEPSNLTLIKKFQIHKPEQIKSINWSFYDYSKYYSSNSFVIPLELIVRFGITSGSSILKKYQNLNENERQRYAEELGIVADFIPWTMLNNPIIDFTTKYEPEDRSLTPQEASALSGLDGKMFSSAIAMALLGSYMANKIFQEMGLQLWDLKWEIARENDVLYFVDTIDTDSVRATVNIVQDGRTYFVHFNKQSMRDYYKIMHPEWYDSVNSAKLEAKKTGVSFVTILKSGQEKGSYEKTPVIDPSFLLIQEEKMKMVKEYSRGGTYDFIKAAKEIAMSEINYYKNSTQWETYTTLNSI